MEVINITMGDAEGDVAKITDCLSRTGGQKLTHLDLHAPPSLPPEKSRVSRDAMRGLCLLLRKNTQNLQRISLSGVIGLKEEDLVEFLESSTSLTLLAHLNLECRDSWSFKFNASSGLQIKKCHLSPDHTTRVWSCLRSFTSLDHLRISDSSLSFSTSPPELPNVTKLSAVRVTSASYDGLISSLSGLEDIDITIDDAEGDIAEITAGLRRTGRQRLTHINLHALPSLPSEKKSVSRETMRDMGLLIRQHTRNLQSIGLSGVIGLNEDDLVEFIESSTSLASLVHLNLESHDSWSFKFDTESGVQIIKKCHLSPDQTTRVWSCLRSLTSLDHLGIFESSLSFPSSSPELPFITKLTAERVTSASYDGLISSLSGLVDIDINIDDAEGDIAQITAGLRRTGEKKITCIKFKTLPSIPPEKNRISRETMRGLGLMIKEHTKNLEKLYLTVVKCTDEDDLVYLIDCCRHVKRIKYIELLSCGTISNGRLHSHLNLLNSPGCTSIKGFVHHDDVHISEPRRYWIPYID